MMRICTDCNAAFDGIDAPIIDGDIVCRDCGRKRLEKLEIEQKADPIYTDPAAAAAVYRQWRDNLDDGATEPMVWADEATPFTGPQVLELLRENAELRERIERIKAEHPTDGNEPLTVEWAMQAASVATKQYWGVQLPMPTGLCLVTKPKERRALIAGKRGCCRDIPYPATRGEFRTLCKVLGIALEEQA